MKSWVAGLLQWQLQKVMSATHCVVPKLWCWLPLWQCATQNMHRRTSALPGSCPEYSLWSQMTSSADTNAHSEMDIKVWRAVWDSNCVMQTTTCIQTKSLAQTRTHRRTSTHWRHKQNRSRHGNTDRDSETQKAQGSKHRVCDFESQSGIASTFHLVCGFLQQ